MNLLQSIDHTLFYLINRSGQNGFFDVFMPIMSNLKFFFIPLGIAWLVMLIKGSLRLRVAALSVLLLLGCTEFINSDVLKPMFNRPRPYYQLSGVHSYDRMSKTWEITPELASPIVGRSQSMPSSHAINIFAAAFFLSFYLRKFWPFFYLVAFLVGYSRVYLGDHFPMDVLAGMAVGTLIAFIFTQLTNRAVSFFESKKRNFSKNL